MKKFAAASAVPKCAICERSVYANDPQIVLDGLSYHRACAKCTECKCQITIQNFNKSGSTLYCKTHYLKKFHEDGTLLGADKFTHKSAPGKFAGSGFTIPISSDNPSNETSPPVPQENSSTASPAPPLPTPSNVTESNDEPLKTSEPETNTEEAEPIQNSSESVHQPEPEPETVSEPEPEVEQEPEQVSTSEPEQEQEQEKEPEVIIQDSPSENNESVPVETSEANQEEVKQENEDIQEQQQPEDDENTSV